MITEPWNSETVRLLNLYQKSGWHPYTCGNDRMDERHQYYAALVGGDYGELVATPFGWICPVCGYKQDWASVRLLALALNPPIGLSSHFETKVS